MTSDLRKRHLIMWIGIIAIIPALMVIAVINIPNYPKDNQLSKGLTVNGETVLKTVEAESLRLRLLELRSGTFLEVQVLQPLKSSSTAVYALNNDLSQGVFIGQIGSKGPYRFPAAGNLSGISVFDTIKEEEITKIQF
ncbi:hypothetical protein GWK08_14215 [Leptobacterium flavescens]|uniref:Uncharacterized protein n=1 Tax=Leptobacterium flavescens TaxID=472055 RepID=A0A6P0UW01_9FLAO|nr:hypothetical protein [Leptobacterium flavescens]NER14606.1 hypothetical protein [Leptobacterium flavescens]